VLSGYYGFHNCGDDAMLEAIVDGLRERVPVLEFTVLSASPRETAEELGVDAVRRSDAVRIWSALRRSRLLVSGGGSLLQDVTSERNLTYHFGLMLLAKAAGCGVMLYGQGIGPIRSSMGRYVLRRIGRLADVITVRDAASAETLRRHGIVGRPVHVTADPALSLRRPDEARGRELMRRAFGGKRGAVIGFALRPWKGRRADAEVFARAADYAAENLGARVLFLPMQHQRDLRVADEVRGLMRRDASVWRERLSPGDALSLISQMDLLVGVRLHSLIFAAMAGVAPVGLSYDPKIDAFLEEIGEAPAGALDDFRLEDFLYALETIWRKRVEVGRRVLERVGRLRARADRGLELASSLILGGGSP